MAHILPWDLYSLEYFAYSLLLVHPLPDYQPVG
ncbi:hypothetical protein HG1285_15851 [Hydrogenivirga sp. 128-5-R1-1]|nr:hypothetical protein HG1285_15851 [Hydrogenivirga sp. 128-5-R1-1]